MPTPPKRTECAGWTDGATRRNTQFLMSIRPDQLSGRGFSITLTFRHCPPTEAHYSAIRRAFVERMRRMGMVRMHWVTEWTKRGLPHLHGIVYFDLFKTMEFVDFNTPPRNIAHEIKQHWLDLTKDYGTTAQAQHVVETSHAPGWFQYMAKHASRGVKHYQRNRDTLPPGWAKTGRVWGHIGDWPTRECKLSVDASLHHGLRRLTRRYLEAQARARVEATRSTARRFAVISGKHGRVYFDQTRPDKADEFNDRYRASLASLSYFRRMLKCNDRRTSTVRGLRNWIPDRVTLAMVDHLVAQGGRVQA